MAIYRNLAEYKDYVLFPSLYERVEAIFPNMEFRRSGNNYSSNHHITGSRDRDGSGKTSTYIYANNKGYIIEQGKESKPLIDFYMEYSNIGDFWTALEALAKDCKVEPFGGDREEYKQYKVVQDSRSAALKAFTSAIWEDTEEAREALSFLRARSWTDSEIKEKGIGLATTTIINTLKERGEFSSSCRDKDGKVIGSIGTTHTLAIPYWNGSRLFGFKIREPRENLRTSDKYLNTYHLTKGEGLFGIGIGIKDVVIVEGELDALHAQAKGCENFAATAGGAAKREQLLDAIQRGAKRFTLLFDNDAAGREYILKVKDGRETGTLPLAEELKIPTYIAKLPDDVKDTDEFFQKGHTAEEVKALVAAATPSCLYRYDLLLDKYSKKEQETGTLSYKDRENFLVEVGNIVNAPYMKAYDREIVFQKLEAVSESLLVGMDGYRDYLNTQWKLQTEKQRRETTEKASTTIQTLLKEGDVNKALRVMKETAEAAGTADKATEYSRAFAPLSPGGYDALLADIREGLPTGYAFTQGTREEALTLNAGLTFICGYRGHGKTTFLNNIALNEAKRQLHIKKQGGEAKSILYFSYEIDRRRLIANLLNTYVNDSAISRKPLATIYSYFRTNGDSTAKAQHFVGQRDGSHFKNFVERKDDFFKNILSSALLSIIDEAYKVEELLEAIKYYLSLRPVSLVCIDYAQLLYSETAKNKARYEEIKKIVNEIKDFANREGIPFVLAAQFNRDVESPVSVDTRSIGEGGDFERIADTCIGLYNLKELHAPSEHGESTELKSLLEKMDIKRHLPDDFDTSKPTSVQGKLFVRLMKRRYGDSPLDTILDWEPLTGYIKQNDEGHFLTEATQGELFTETDEDDVLPF